MGGYGNSLAVVPAFVADFWRLVRIVPTSSRRICCAPGRQTKPWKPHRRTGLGHKAWDSGRETAFDVESWRMPPHGRTRGEPVPIYHSTLPSNFSASAPFLLRRPIGGGLANVQRYTSRHTVTPISRLCRQKHTTVLHQPAYPGSSRVRLVPASIAHRQLAPKR